MKRNEYGDACYDESNVLYWVLISPDGEATPEPLDKVAALRRRVDLLLAEDTGSNESRAQIAEAYAALDAAAQGTEEGASRG